MGKPYNITRFTSPVDASFMDEGTCRKEGARTDIFFADSGRRVEDRLAVQEALSFCIRCEVRVECLEYAIDCMEHGVWGGTTLDERDRIRQKRRRQGRW